MNDKIINEVHAQARAILQISCEERTKDAGHAFFGETNSVIGILGHHFPFMDRDGDLDSPMIAALESMP